MNLEELISEGEEVKHANIQESSMGGHFISGEDYERWITKCIIHLENNLGNFSQTIIDKFIKASEKAVGNDVGYYDTMIGILKALKETE